jgi:tRNA-splicing ligase RtcB
MKIDSSNRIPIKMWLDDIEDTAMKQATNLANLPFAFSHVALMPDCHMGYGMPIGGVMATEGVVVPNAVGVDIGCGVCAVKTTLQGYDIQHLDALKRTLELIRRNIPVGFNRHSKSQLGMPYRGCELHVVDRKYSKAAKSLGTLGGGNHFIELQADSDGFLWVMIHSGSRNLGLQVAKYWNDVAKAMNEKWFSRVSSSWDLAFLPLDVHQGQNYINEMDYCVKYALANRQRMMDVVLDCLVGGFKTEFSTDEMINISHNYARLENHFGKNVMVHRKGATSAKADEIGIIPGSQGTASYIVRGLGNPQSFESCSHGAGRKMGRKQAIRELDLGEQKAILDGKGILHGIRGPKDLDEAPGAYKDIDVVMNNQRDLVEIITELRPLAVVKG